MSKWEKKLHYAGGLRDGDTEYLPGHIVCGAIHRIHTRVTTIRAHVTCGTCRKKLYKVDKQKARRHLRALPG